jgi:uncharacterized repeat protein (TIGR01451 family)
VSDRLAGRTIGGQVGRLSAALAAAGLAAAFAAAGLAPAVVAAEPLSLTTPYPQVSVAPGSKVTFDLDVKTTEERRVTLAVSAVPEGWTATIRGGGYVVDGVLVGPDASPSIRLDVTVPADAAAKTYTMTVTASSDGLTDSLPLDVRVSQSAAGDVTASVDFPLLRGPSSSTFRFNVTVRNETAEDLTFALNAQGPAGWLVTARPSGQTQAGSVQIDAGGSTGIQVEADPPNDVAAGQYPIDFSAVAGEKQVQGQLAVEITGQYEMDLTTPDGRLNANGTAGGTIARTLVLANNGTAPLTEVKLSETAPSGWKVTYEPPTVAAIAPGEAVNVTANIAPAGSAVAGDYLVTFRATAKESTNTDVQIRVTIETSILWAIVGILLIVAVLGGLGWVFQRYGRR